MKKTILTVSLSSIIALTGCSSDNNHESNESMEKGRNQANPSQINSPATIYDEDYQNKDNSPQDFGFTHLTNATINGKKINNQTPTIDREQLASIITQLTVQLPNVKEASTLVTDEKVLVVYSTDTSNRFMTADQVKRTAASAVPRYYHIYVSDNYVLARDIEDFSLLSTQSRDVDPAIKSIIQLMLKSPQGNRLSDGENENGKMKGETSM